MPLTGVRAVRQNLFSEGRGKVLIFVALGWMLSLGSRYIFPVLFPHLREAFGLSLTVLGAFYTLLWVGYATLQFAGGLLADKYGEQFILAFSTAMTGCTMLVLALSTSSLMLATGMFIFGVTSGLYGTTRYTILVDIYPVYDSTAVGITQSAGEAGNIALPVIASFLVAFGTWRLGFGYLTPFFFLVALGLFVVVPGRTSGEESVIDELSFNSLRYVVDNIRSNRSLTLALILTLTTFTIQGVSTFYPTYLIDIKGLSPRIAALMFSSMFVSAGIVMPLAGVFADTYSVRSTLGLAISLATIALILFPFASGILLLVSVTVMFTSVYGVLTIAVTELANSMPSDMRGIGLGALRTSYILLAAPGSVIVGKLADVGLFDESFFILAVPAVIAVVLTRRL